MLLLIITVAFVNKGYAHSYPSSLNDTTHFLSDSKAELEYRSLFAIKTNLLYDAVTAINVELEVPLGKRWSVSGEWMFPWWKALKSNCTLQMMAGQGTVNYWLGDMHKRELLTGWSIGLCGGMGTYDVQLFTKHGERGEFWDVGMQTGYAHKIAKNWRLSYVVVGGYMQRDYKKYDQVADTKYGLIKVFRYPWETKRNKWIGPISVKISFVWLLNYKAIKKTGGVR